MRRIETGLVTTFQRDMAGDEDAGFEDADFVGEIACEFEELAQHLSALNEKRAELRLRALNGLTAAPQSPRFSE